MLPLGDLRGSVTQFLLFVGACCAIRKRCSFEGLETVEQKRLGPNLGQLKAKRNNGNYRTRQ